MLQVERGTPAWSAGLRPGDIIVAVNRRAVKRLEEVTAAIQQHPGMLLLNIRRGSGSLFVMIQ